MLKKKFEGGKTPWFLDRLISKLFSDLPHKKYNKKLGHNFSIFLAETSVRPYVGGNLENEITHFQLTVSLRKGKH